MRLFAAALPDEQMSDALIQLQNELRSHGIRGTYHPREKLHMTLTFIGEYSDPEFILDLLRKFPAKPFTIRLSGVVIKNNNCLAAVECPEEYISYVKSFRNLLSENSVPFSEGEIFPHFTLIKNVKGWLHDEIVVPDISQVIDSFAVMRSDQGENGNVYTELGRVKVL